MNGAGVGTIAKLCENTLARECRLLGSEQERQLSWQQAIAFALSGFPIGENFAPDSMLIKQCPLLLQHNFASAEETGAFMGKINPQSRNRKINFLNIFSSTTMFYLYPASFKLSNHQFLKFGFYLPFPRSIALLIHATGGTPFKAPLSL